MDCYENFKSRCSFSEVKKVYGQMPYETLMEAYDIYKKVSKERCEKPDFAGICALYIMGFLSGCRAMKERRKIKKNDTIRGD